MTASRAADEIRDLVLPLVDALGCRLYDVELSGSGRARTLRVLIDRDGGVDLDAITAATHAVSPLLDDVDRAQRTVPPRGEQPRARAPAAPPRALRRRDRRDGLDQVPHRQRAPSGVRGALVDADGEHACIVEIDGEREEIAYDDDHARRAPCSSGARSRVPGSGARRRSHARAKG